MTRRYIIQFDSARLPRIDTDFLVIGSGIAALRAANEASQHGDVLLITKSVIKENNLRYAQSEIDSIMGENDSITSYVEDTLKTGEGLCDEAAVETMVTEGVKQIAELIQCSPHRDKEWDTILASQLKKQERVRVIEQVFIIDFMTQEDRCYGVVALIDEVLYCIFAKATILASGGLGHIYQSTSNTEAATTGDGLAAAWRAGCKMIDMEFIQFHPTTLLLMEAPRFLITERMREEGGILINSRGERFMAKYHEMEELAPCDVVSRAILNEMELTGSLCVYLDVTHLSSDFIRSCFSRIYQFCDQFGIDITTDVMPVKSDAHFMMGGVHTNLSTETTLRGLYACGEVACTGVHGASWIPSNPLLECMVFGTRAASAAVEYMGTVQSDNHTSLRITSDDDSALPQTTSEDIEIEEAKEFIQEMMWQHVGLVRHGEDLEAVLDELGKLNLNCYWDNTEAFEFQNMRDVAALITEAALLRTESRGVHLREDFPEQDNIEWRKHITFQHGQPAKIVV